MPELGKATYVIVIDSKQFEKDLERVEKKTEAATEAIEDGFVDVEKQSAKSSKKVREDQEGVGDAVEDVGRKMDKVLDKIGINELRFKRWSKKVRKEATKVDQELAKLWKGASKSGDRTIKFKIDKSITGLAEAEAALDVVARNRDVEFSVKRSAIDRMQGAVSGAFDGIDRRANRSGGVLSGIFMSLGNLVGAFGSQVATMGSKAWAAGGELTFMGMSGAKLAAVIAAVLVLVTALVVAVVALVSSLAMAAAALGALAVAGGALMLAFGVGAMAAITRFKNTVGEAESAATKLRDRFKEVKSAFQQATKGGADKVLAGAAQALARFGPMLQKLEPAFTRFGGAVGKALSAIGKNLTTPTWIKSWQKLFGMASKAIGPLSKSLTAVFAIMRNIAMAAMPFLIKGLRSVAKTLGGWNKGTKNLEETRSVIGNMVGHLKSWWNFLKAVGGALGDLMGLAAGEGKSMVDTLTAGVNKMREFLQSAKGGREVKEFFAGFTPLINEMFTFIGKAVVLIAQAVQFLTPALAPLFKGANMILSVFMGLFAMLNKIPAPIRAVGLIIGVAFLGPIGAVAAAIAALGLLWDPLKAAAVSAWNWISDAAGRVWDRFKAIGNFVGGPLSAYFKAWKAVASAAFQVIHGLAILFYNKALKPIIQALSGPAKFAFNLIKTVAVAAFMKITAPARNLFSLVKGGFEKILSVAKSVAPKLGGAFSSAWESIKGVFSDGVSAAIDFLNMIIDALNHLPEVDIGRIGGGVAIDNSPGSGGRGRGRAGTTRNRRGGVERQGEVVNAPGFFAGEEAPRHHEYILATNPKYRDRNMGLWAAAGADLGVPGFAQGGIPGFGIGGVVSSGISSGANAVSGAAGSVKDSITDTAGSVISAFPSPGDFLPDWLLSTGGWAINEMKDWAKGKAGDVAKSVGNKVNPFNFAGGVWPAYAQGGLRPAKGRGVKFWPGGSPKSPKGDLWSADEAATGLWQTGLDEARSEQLSTKLFGESGGRSNAVGNDPGGTHGLGLFQITTGYNDDLIAKYGGIGAMKKAIPNLFAARDIMRRQGIGAWYAGSGAPGRVRKDWALRGGPTKGDSTRKKNVKGKGTKKASSLGLSAGVQKRIKSHSSLADLYEEYANRASALEGAVFGIEERGWLEKELVELIMLRNALIEALSQLQAYLDELNAQIAGTAPAPTKSKKGPKQQGAGPGNVSRARLKDNAWVDSHTMAVGHWLADKMNTSITDGWRPQNAGYGAANSSHKRGTPDNPGALDFAAASRAFQNFAGRNVAGLTENLLNDAYSTGPHNHIAFFKKGGVSKGKKKKGPSAGGDLKALKSERGKVTAKIAEVGSALSDVEGLGPWAGIPLSTLPPVGEIGGRIFDVQTRTRDLGGSGSGSGGVDSGGMTVDNLKEVMALKSLGVTFNTDQFAGVFHAGGQAGFKSSIDEGFALVRNRETLLNEDQTQAIGDALDSGDGAGSTLYAEIYVGGEKIDERVDVRLKKRHKKAKNAYKAGV